MCPRTGWGGRHTREIGEAPVPRAPGSSSPGAGLTDEGRADGRGRQRVGHDDQEDRIAQEERDLEGNSLATVRRQVEAHDVHNHEEDTGQKQADRIEEGPSADDNLGSREELGGVGADRFWAQEPPSPSQSLLLHGAFSLDC